MNDHTPPEWTLAPRRNEFAPLIVQTPTGETLATVNPNGPSPEADARLIIAAPHLANAALIALGYLRGAGTTPNVAAAALAFALRQAGVIDDATARAWSGDALPHDR